MAITELNLTPGRREKDWILNGVVTDASGGIDLREAIPDYRYGIKKLTITPNVEGKWVKILDGDDTIIGPIASLAYVPYQVEFNSVVYGEAGNALILKTQEAFPVHVLIEGKTSPPIPSKPFNPSPANGETSVSTDTELSWESVYQSVNYRVFFGTDNNPDLVSTQSENTYSPSLLENTTYYWRINEFLNGNTVVGDTWTFST